MEDLNRFQRAARDRKVFMLVTALEKKGVPPEVCCEWTSNQWAEFAKEHRVLRPSLDTAQEVLQILIARKENHEQSTGSERSV